MSGQPEQTDDNRVSSLANDSRQYTGAHPFRRPRTPGTTTGSGSPATTASRSWSNAESPPLAARSGTCSTPTVSPAAPSLSQLTSLLGDFTEAKSNTCPIMERCVCVTHRSPLRSPPPSGAVVEKLCEYMAFRACYENAGPKEDIPVQDFMERIPPEVALELSVLDASPSQHTCSLSATGCWLLIIWKVCPLYSTFKRRGLSSCQV